MCVCGCVQKRQRASPGFGRRALGNIHRGQDGSGARCRIALWVTPSVSIFQIQETILNVKTKCKKKLNVQTKLKKILLGVTKKVFSKESLFLQNPCKAYNRALIPKKAPNTALKQHIHTNTHMHTRTTARYDENALPVPHILVSHVPHVLVSDLASHVTKGQYHTKCQHHMDLASLAVIQRRRERCVCKCVCV